MFYMKFFYQKYLYNFLSVFDFNTQNSILFTLFSLKKNSRKHWLTGVVYQRFTEISSEIHYFSAALPLF